ncbi:MotA/TolQ/ExbB proton channel family protein [candidate division KSB1 bacterium]|nr:MotA/TolQ/ExbB proton channel family protein [candidate division KSB1 bacterium]
MILISLCSLAALAIFIERLITLRKIKLNARTFVLQIQNLLMRGKLDDALKTCKQTPGPIASLTKAVLEKYDRSYEEIKEALENAARSEIYHLEKYLSALGTVAAVAPLLGFLGTVTGMISVFQVMAVSGSGNVRAMAAGVSQATVPTMAGMVGALSGVLLVTLISRRAAREVEFLEDSLTMDH